ncbi:MAG: gliding motility-associated C-terminal domain-containing protein [Bacteroidota bacterium]
MNKHQHIAGNRARRSRFASLCIVFIILLFPSLSFATHNLAGQITLEQNDPNNTNSYTITLTTYTDPSVANVDRCSADIEIWAVTGMPGRPGAPGTPSYVKIATLEQIPRANGVIMSVPPQDCNIANPRNGVEVKGPVKRNLYFTDFVFPGPGLYQLRYFDKNRRTGIANMDNSEQLAFYIETQLFITPPIIGNNNTPVLLNEPLDDACQGKIWTHNPGGFDPDGDSLVYYLRPSFQYDPPTISTPISVTNYRFPDAAEFGPGNTMTMDSLTGLITWDAPGRVDLYNFAYVVEEWRDGVLLGYVIRDMAVFVQACDNNPPIIESITDTCVTAGEQVSFEFRAWDPDEEDSLYLRLNNGPFGNNGPFSVDNPAEITGRIIDGVVGPIRNYTNLPQATVNNGIINGSPADPDTIKGDVTWNTTCDNIRKQFYQIDFFASDNENYALASRPGITTLTANKVVTIRVIPPPPLNLRATKGSRVVNVEWDPPICVDMVVGYNVYRKVEGSDFMQDTVCCEMSPTAAGFDLVNYNVGPNNLSFLDSLTDINGIFGKEICYVVTALYDDQNNPDVPVMESCADGPACIEVENEILYLTNDSVSVTDAVNGEIFLSWSQPEIDPFFPQPFSYRLYRANNNAFPAIDIIDLPYGDTTYTDVGLNTELRAYNYRVEVFDSLGILVNTSPGENIGSSIYLTATGGNGVVELEWTEFVPWANSSYEVHRSETGINGTYTPIATVNGTGGNVHTYRDTAVIINEEYCYFIRSIGSHNVADIKPLLLNDSQKECAFAQDEEPPCPPTASVVGDCEALRHDVTITKSMLDCASDTDSIRILFGPSEIGPFRLVESLAYNSFGEEITITFDFTNSREDLAGCYVVTAVDSLGNVSELSAVTCIDFCPLLEMSNVFTPNQDGINDVFKPRFHRDVILKEVQIFDRWGRLMHTSIADIDVLWSGEVDGSSREAREGVYYYYIRYEELGINGNTPREEKGWVSLFR